MAIEVIMCPLGSVTNYLIYKLTSPTGKSYICQTNNIKRLISQHKRLDCFEVKKEDICQYL